MDAPHSPPPASPRASDPIVALVLSRPLCSRSGNIMKQLQETCRVPVSSASDMQARKALNVWMGPPLIWKLPQP
eukprot:3901240-Prymnesium_polylepis.2